MTTKTQNHFVLHENPDVKQVGFFMLPASPWMKKIAQQLMEIYGVLEDDLRLREECGVSKDKV